MHYSHYTNEIDILLAKNLMINDGLLSTIGANPGDIDKSLSKLSPKEKRKITRKFRKISRKFKAHKNKRKVVEKHYILIAIGRNYLNRVNV